MFEVFKRTLLELGPCPGFPFSGEQVERGYDVGEIQDEFSVKIHESCKRPDSLDRGGGFHSFMASSFFSSILTSPCPMIIPRNSMRGASNMHFESLIDSPYSRSRWSTRRVHS